MAKKRIVVFSILGTTLDAGVGPRRWDRWRPTVDLCRHEDLVVDRLVLLHGRASKSLARAITADIAQVSPETTVVPAPIEFVDPWDFEKVYAALLDFARGERFAPEREDYLVHITTGTHVAQICWFLLTEARFIPGRLLQTGPPSPRTPKSAPGSHAIIDLDLSKYDAIAQRFARVQREGLSLLKGGIDTHDRAFNTLIGQIERVALASREPVLLLGPTGAGKTRLAQRIHELRRTRGLLAGDLVEINCATLRGDQAMS
ncbi:MAG: RNA repair transcriptional activator RtcR family protein, partial [Deltaproteobacteria bacterium]